MGIEDAEGTTPVDAEAAAAAIVWAMVEVAKMVRAVEVTIVDTIVALATAMAIGDATGGSGMTIETS
jgi:hypothetical protein